MFSSSRLSSRHSRLCLSFSSWSIKSGCPPTGSLRCWSHTPPDAPAAGTRTRTLRSPRSGWDRRAAASAASCCRPRPQLRLPADRWPWATPDTTPGTRCNRSPWPTAGIVRDRRTLSPAAPAAHCPGPRPPPSPYLAASVSRSPLSDKPPSTVRSSARSIQSSASAPVSTDPPTLPRSAPAAASCWGTPSCTRRSGCSAPGSPSHPAPPADGSTVRRGSFPAPYWRAAAAPPQSPLPARSSTLRRGRFGPATSASLRKKRNSRL